MLYRHLSQLRDNRACRKEADRLRPERRIDNIYRLGGLQINAGKIFIFDDDKLALFVFITLYNLIPRHFLAVGFRYREGKLLSKAFVIASFTTEWRNGQRYWYTLFSHCSAYWALSVASSRASEAFPRFFSSTSSRISSNSLSRALLPLEKGHPSLRCRP